MPLIPIKKSEGITKSEKYLLFLAERSFLKLWSYPNLYKQPGKELCDLLVVCDEHILVFSDKTVAWPEKEDWKVAWSRWYKKAIRKSADQVKGAVRWLENYPNKIYLNAACTERFPLALPPREKRKITGIVVALGAEEACINFLGKGSGSFLVKPEIRGNDHINMQSAIFAIGDINPDDEFIHVFNDVTLTILMEELDTITDFTEYLNKKEKFLRSGHLTSAPGEEELLALYLMHINENQEHYFPIPGGEKITENCLVVPDSRFYDQLRSHPSYLKKTHANIESYKWDNLIKVLTEPIMNATAFSQSGIDYSLAEHEKAVRHMALECRLNRRILGKMITEAIEKGQNEPCFSRAIIPMPKDQKRKTGYVFLMLAHPKNMGQEVSYKQYRSARLEILRAYCAGHSRKHQHLERFIGIAMEPPPKVSGSTEISEDFVLFEAREWTEEIECRILELCKRYNILPEKQYEKRLQKFEVPTYEYPN